MIRSYVKRGRMTQAQKRSYVELSPRYSVPFSGALISLEGIFQNNNPVTCEIGFGMGAATAIIAEANPDKNYLCIEVYKAGIGHLLWEVEKRGIKNIRVIEYDAMEVINHQIADNSLAAFHIFFPDPWPKKKHFKRRLIQKPFTDMLAQKLIRGGYVYMVTDWADYGDWALRELSATAGLSNAYSGFAPPQSWRPETKFEVKGRVKEHHIWELYFTKI
jgi:tRNA (guanine-N7-)-methyltransferase